MVRGKFPKAYLRIDPDLDAKHPDNLAEFVRTMCAANRQPRRGRFRSRAVLEANIGKAATRRAVSRGDVISASEHACQHCPPGDPRPDELYLDGWDIWQEGDLTVGDRMQAYRSRNAAVTNGVTPSVTNPSPPSEASGGRRQTVTTLPTPEPPNPHDADDIEVLADGLLLHAATPNQLRAVRTLSRKVGTERTVEVMRSWMTRNEDDRFGGALGELAAEAKGKRERKESKWAYMDESS